MRPKPILYVLAVPVVFTTLSIAILGLHVWLVDQGVFLIPTLITIDGNLLLGAIVALACRIDAARRRAYLCCLAGVVIASTAAHLVLRWHAESHHENEAIPLSPAPTTTITPKPPTVPANKPSKKPRRKP